MEATVYNQKGEKSGKVNLPKEVFGLTWNADLVHQVVTSLMTNARKPFAHVKTRGEVRGGGRKPWQQKGTGRARHGSSRSPIWVGGGVTHGPRNEKNFARKVNKKMKAKALYTILSKKYKEGEVFFIDNLNITTPKTKEAKAIMNSLGTTKEFKQLVSKRKNSAYIATAEKNVPIEKSFQNFGNMHVEEARNINPVDLMNYKYVVFLNPEKSVDAIAHKLS